MSSLPEPHFIDRDPVVILKECIERFEQISGRKLSPDQAEALLVQIIAYRETLVRIGVQEAGKQNLRAYGRFPMIDLLFELIGGARLEPQPATTTERFTLDAVQGVNTPIPVNTRIRTKDGKVIFTTDEDKVIAAGDLTITVGVTATEAGPLGNGYGPGQVSDILDDLGVAITAENLDTTENGTAGEDTERMRERMPTELGRYAAAGPEDGYEAHALAAHPDVLDVWVQGHDPDVPGSPEPGVARVHVLATYGVPTDELIAIVDAALSPKTVRPICDKVEVAKAVEVTYALTAILDLKSGSLVAPTMAAANAAAVEFTGERTQRLGRSIIRTQVTTKLSKPELREDQDGSPVLMFPELAGVYRVNLPAPAADVVLAPNEFATCTAISVTFGTFVQEQ
jgi:phage-related baseplate assembly protein